MNHDLLTVGMVYVIGLEGWVPQRSVISRIRTIPVAVLAKIAIAYMIVDPPSMKIVRAGRVVVRRDSAVAILERCLAIVRAGTVQGNGPVVAFSLIWSEELEAISALRVKSAPALTRKEVTRNKKVQRVAVGRPSNTPHNYGLHVVMVVCASGVAGFQ